MTVANGFQLLGSGEGWPDASSGITSVSVRPYVAPSSSNSYTATGFERFRTLGGYSNSDSGNPTQAQIDLSLVNAMKIFYNIEKASAGSAEANISEYTGASVSTSSSAALYNTVHSSSGSNTNLTPEERALSGITGKHNGNTIVKNRLETPLSEDSFSSTAPASSIAKVQMDRRIKRLYDNSGSSPVFLGYGIENKNSRGNNQLSSDASAASGLDGVGGFASCAVGSFFNRHPDDFKPASDSPQQVDFLISDITYDSMPLLSSCQTTYFDGNENEGTSSLSSSSASISFPYLDVTASASASISGSSTFYTYN
tara:strand:- start:199 stop:1134 length:936 start_codon:yes stop_codon:yes gene_type:complete